MAVTFTKKGSTVTVRLQVSVAAIVVALVGALSTAFSNPQKKTNERSHAALAEELSRSRAEVIKATEEFKASLEKLILFIEGEVATRAGAVQKRKQLESQGLASRREIQEAERALAESEAALRNTRGQIAEADRLIAEVKAAELLDKSSSRASFLATGTLIRYRGMGKWSLADASKLQTFYLGKFGVQLPLSAFGQTAVHDRMGYDHREAIDIAVHPDTPEGQALMAYLKSAGIPFLAFRQAVPGSATGAHIHVGNPSPRLLPRTTPGASSK